MQKFEITVTETNRAVFYVEAETAEEAQELFANMVSNEITDRGSVYWLESALEDGYEGYQYEAVPTDTKAELDFIYDELKEKGAWC